MDDYPRDAATLIDIVAAARLAQEFVLDVDQAAFAADAKTRSAEVYELLVIGEAVKRLSNSFRSRHPQVPWIRIAGMRDHLIHACDTVDWDEVWGTVRTDIPRLLTQLEPLLPPSED